MLIDSSNNVFQSRILAEGKRRKAVLQTWLCALPKWGNAFVSLGVCANTLLCTERAFVCGVPLSRHGCAQGPGTQPPTVFLHVQSPLSYGVTLLSVPYSHPTTLLYLKPLHLSPRLLPRFCL